MKGMVRGGARGHGCAAGQALVEYALLLSLIAVVSVGTLRGLGQNIVKQLALVQQGLE